MKKGFIIMSDLRVKNQKKTHNDAPLTHLKIAEWELDSTS